MTVPRRASRNSIHSNDISIEHRACDVHNDVMTISRDDVTRRTTRDKQACYTVYRPACSVEHSTSVIRSTTTVIDSVQPLREPIGLQPRRHTLWTVS